MRVAATILLCLFFAADAHAATVSVSGATLRVTAAPGEVNRVAIAPATGVLTITDAGAPLTAGDGCVAAGAAVECASLPLLDVAADLGDGDDTLTSTAMLPLLVTDGDGADSITGGAAADTFIASPGADATQAAAARTSSRTRPAATPCWPTATTSPTTARPARATTSAATSSASRAAPRATGSAAATPPTC